MEVELINIVSFGGGTNSAAMLVGLHQHGIPVDLILFADKNKETFKRTMNAIRLSPEQKANITRRVAERIDQPDKF